MAEIAKIQALIFVINYLFLYCLFHTSIILLTERNHTDYISCCELLRHICTQTAAQGKKNPRNNCSFWGYSSQWEINYLLLNWGARRAAFRPY
ncbi:MAG: hypothetical protein IJX67_10125, partial [Oscillospiraceae bacterium]|nr:hypothetical protein [Oscillospiraceae bacterium]